jgi:hypothetical protein
MSSSESQSVSSLVFTLSTTQFGSARICSKRLAHGDSAQAHNQLESEAYVFMLLHETKAVAMRVIGRLKVG